MFWCDVQARPGMLSAVMGEARPPCTFFSRIDSALRLAMRIPVENSRKKPVLSMSYVASARQSVELPSSWLWLS